MLRELGALSVLGALGAFSGALILFFHAVG